MKREVLLLFSVYVLSLFTAKVFPQPDMGIVVIFLLIIFLLRMFVFRSRRVFAVVLLLCAGLGFARTAYLNNPMRFVPGEFFGKTVYVCGTVQEVAEDDDYCQYTIQPEEVYVLTTEEQRIYAPVDYKISVTVYERYATIAPYAYGDRIRVRGTLKLPEGPENTGAFDYALWHRTNGVYACIRTDEANTKYIGEAKIGVLQRMVHAVRDYAKESFKTYIGGENSAILSGIMLSDRTGMSEELRSAVNTAGLSHLFVASGMHLSLLCGLLLFLLSKLRLPRAVSLLICALLMHFFALVVGGGASIQRAVLMFDFSVLAYLTRGDEDRLYSCMCVAFLMLLLQPLYLFSTGFLLSFACVFGILFLERPMRRILNRICKWKALGEMLSIGLCAQVFTLPIVATCFHALPLYSVLYNLLIGWLVAPLMVLGGTLLAFAGFWPLAAQGIGFVLKLILSAVGKVILSVQYLPLALVTAETPGLFGCLLYYALVFAVWACISKKEKYALLFGKAIHVCMLVLTIGSIVGCFYAKLYFLNVGEGDCALLSMPYGLNVLVDGGGVPREYNNVGEETVLPYLRSRGICELDYAVVSHYDTDHVDGVLYLCENMRVRNLILPYRHPKYISENKSRLEACAAERGIRLHYVRSGDIIDLPGDLCIEVLAPDEEMLKRRLAENNLSLVMRVRYGDMRVLFTGDVEKLAEKRLLESGADVQTEILKVAHHGSTTSTMPQFLEATDARYAVISAGDYEVAKHPSKRVYRALVSSGTEVYNTATSGDIAFCFTRRGVCWIW